MSAPPHELNILDLLDSLAKEGGTVWREALLLTFNFEAPFFEGRILGRLRALGARVAVLADAGVWDPDPITLGNAGRAYLVSPVVLPGAFHPKLVLLVGDDRALALIGSGNVSRGGWALNAELWNTFEATSGQAPSALFELAPWLEQLSRSSIGMSVPARQRLRDVADALSRVLDGCRHTDDTSRLIANLDRPIAEGIPRTLHTELLGPEQLGPELLVGSPFVDGRALRTVVDRIQPSSVTWLVQELLTRADLASVRSQLADGPVLAVLAERLSDVNGHRTRHGKFIEWRTSKGWVSVTGSPNLTTQALIRTLAQGGNVEIAVLRTSERSLWPDPSLDPATMQPLGATDDIDLAPREPPTKRHPDAGPTILSAVLDGDSLLVVLAYPARSDCVIETCIDPLHDRWQNLGTIPAGATDARLPAAAGGARLLRASYDAQLQPGPVTPVTDVEAVQRFPGRPEQDRGSWASKRDVLKDGPLSFLLALDRQLRTIAGEIQRRHSARAARTTHDGRAAPEVHRDTDETRTAWLWDEWEAISTRRHGGGLRQFARGLPAVSPDWKEAPPVEAFDEGEDPPPTADPGQSPDDAEAAPRVPWELEREQIDRCVGRLRRYAALDESIPSPDFYLAVGQVTLYLYTLNTWPDDDPEPVELLRRFLEAALEAPLRLLPADSIKTLGEIARTLVSHRVDFSAGTEASLAARDLFTTVDDAPGVIDVALLEEMLQFDEGMRLLTASGTPLTAIGVLEAIDARQHRGNFNAAVRVAESLGLEAMLSAPDTLTVTGRFTDPVRLACQLLEGLEGPVALRLIGSQRRFTILWRDPDFYVITHHTQRWEHLRSPRGLTGIALTEQPGTLRVPHGPLLRPIPEADELARHLGVELTCVATGRQHNR